MYSAPCVLCGVSRLHHAAKGHAYCLDEVRPSFDLGVSLEPSQHVDEGLLQRVQAAARNAYADGKLAIFDPDASRDAIAPTKPGRVVVEPIVGGGLVGSQPVADKRIYVRQNEGWVKQLGYVVAMSAHARRRCPYIDVGDKVVFTRCSGEEILVPVSGYGIPASFLLFHIDDVEGKFTDDDIAVVAG